MKYLKCKFGLSFQGGAKEICNNLLATDDIGFEQIIAVKDAISEDFATLNDGLIIEEITEAEAIDFAVTNKKPDEVTSVLKYQVDENENPVLDSNGNPVVEVDASGLNVTEEKTIAYPPASIPTDEDEF